MGALRQQRADRDDAYGMTEQAIAEVYGVSMQAIQATMKRAIRKLWRQSVLRFPPAKPTQLTLEGK